MVKDDAEVTSLKQELNDLIEKCKADQETAADCKLSEKCSDMADPPKCRLASRKVLKGHINKVNSIHFAGDSRYVRN
jgi:guanine nucleotide-binding protein subunit beta, other